MILILTGADYWAAYNYYYQNAGYWQGQGYGQQQGPNPSPANSSFLIFVSIVSVLNVSNDNDKMLWG